MHDVLREIGADGVPRLEVFNKCDELAPERIEAGFGWPRIESGPDGRNVRVFASAKTGAGMDLVIRAVRSEAAGAEVMCVARIPPSQGRLRAAVYERSKVVNEVCEPDGTNAMTFTIEPAALARLNRDTRLAEYLDRADRSDDTASTRLARKS